MTKAKDFVKKGNCKNNHCSSMSNQAGTDLKNDCDILKLHDKCPNPECNCQKLITFTPHQYMLEGGLIKSKLQKFFRGTKKPWDSFIKPGIKIATRLISTAVAAKTKSPQSAQITNNFLKTLTGGMLLSLSDMQGRGLTPKVL